MGKVLITGASGFVGRHLLRALVAQGADVRAVLRPNAVEKVQTVAAIEVVESPSPFSESETWWADALSGIDTIVHLAWYAEPGKYLTAPENLDCLTGTLTMAKAAATVSVRRFVGVGTCFEYDVSFGKLSIETPLKPLTPYAAAKAAAFIALSQWLPAQSVEFAWCRLFYLYGEGEDERRFVPYLRKSLEAGQRADLTEGRQVRDFMDVRDAAARICEVTFGKATGAINVCSGVPVTVRELAERIADQYGRRDLLNFGARPDNLVDPPFVLGVP
ncbi:MULTISPECIES: NAD-dependent epimerase/dehydratase family protein [Rhizobium]|uniref:NAD-dependent epimerase/dehydratase family protein n=1 Tax=Rhizobium favelukesii TaxID=348824 RepID=W6R349_9HYPH|nr:MULTISPECIES: NAD(P)-dependent oxidoreductase [Rhizobium]MCS0461355.1 NAD(P)-dependent oxidoreductase [Rhizobium favelukesii]UFS82503.1 NAD(P)-dependent oxidoreductase [Rhizobium sp. T136]CDM55777.1 NAD-dependent epimerase/dehydratase family protein [Rhizobium favelukesii]